VTAADARMLQTRDNAETIPEVSQRGEILRELVAGSGFLRNERIPENAKRQTDQQQAARLFSSLCGMGDTTE
jgi:hypothetical protein